MAKPAPAEKPQSPSPQPKVPPARRIRVIQKGSNNYDVVVDEYEGPPTRTKVLRQGVARTVAIYDVRLYLEEYLGPDRVGDSGL